MPGGMCQETLVLDPRLPSREEQVRFELHQGARVRAFHLKILLVLPLHQARGGEICPCSSVHDFSFFYLINHNSGTLLIHYLSERTRRTLLPTTPPWHRQELSPLRPVPSPDMRASIYVGTMTYTWKERWHNARRHVPRDPCA